MFVIMCMTVNFIIDWYNYRRFRGDYEEAVRHLLQILDEYFPVKKEHLSGG